MILLALTASAAPHRIAALKLPTDPDATVEVLPTVEPGRVELLVHGGSDLGEVFQGVLPEGVRTGRVTDLGGHTVVTAWMSKPGTTLSVSRAADGWIAVPEAITPAKGGRSPTCSAAPPGQSEAAGLDAAPARRAPAAALVPLHGADHLLAFHGLPLDLPRWQAAEPDRATWARVATLRAALFDGGEADAAGLYELGAIHRDLGHLREAAFYFGRAQDFGAPGVAGLQRAEALLRTGDPDGARIAAIAAAEAGAPEEAVMVVLATVSLEAKDALTPADLLEVPGLFAGPADPATAAPTATSAAAPRADTPADPRWDADLARALASHDGALAALLGGALLLRDDCWEEATPALTRAAAAAGPVGPLAAVLLADAHLLAGDLDGADAALAHLPATAPAAVGRLARARAQLVALLRQSPNQWPALVPALEGTAAHRDGDDIDEEALESLFLLGQIGARLGDDDLAIQAFGTLVDRRRRLLDGEPGARLAAAWARRTGGLLAAGRPVEALTAHVAAWRTGLELHLSDPAPLVAMATVWHASGLDDEALATLGAVATIEARGGLDDRETVLAIADAYRRGGHLEEALDALDFLATRPKGPGAEAIDARVALLRGRTLLDGGDVDAARAAWKAAPPAGRAEATLRVALVDAEAGRCDGLDALVASPALPEDLSPGRIDAARTACLVTLGRPDEARAAAAVAATTLVDPDAAAWARAVADDPVEGAWRRLADDDRAEASLRARLPRAAPRAPSPTTPAPIPGGT